MAADWFLQFKEMTDADWAALPPLVKKGEDRETVLNAIVEKWCTPTSASEPGKGAREAIQAHVAAGGFVLEGVAFIDENTNEPIDLEELLSLVNRRLDTGVATSFEARPDLFILLRRCRIDRCYCDSLRVRPRFVAFQTKFGDRTFFGSTMFSDGALFDLATFGDGSMFHWARFGDAASFAEATFGDGAFFSGARFGDAASFAEATFGDGADFSGARFGDAASFEFTTFGDGVMFFAATFGDEADFGGAAFGDGADFRWAGIGRNGSFKHTRLAEADLRSIWPIVSAKDRTEKGRWLPGWVPEWVWSWMALPRGFVPDETIIRGARFSARPSDPWSKLRAAYTGPRLIFNLLFLILFFLPLGARTIGWAALGEAEERAAAAMPELRERAESLRSEDPHIAAWLDESIAAVEQRLPREGSDAWRETNVISAVLGWHNGWFIFVPAVLLLGYNLGRGGMTFVIAPMRDAEERSGITPTYWPLEWEKLKRKYESEKQAARTQPKAEWRPTPIARGWGWLVVTWRYLMGYLEAYGWLIWPHRVLTFLFWVAVGSFFWNAIYWLFLQPIWLPK